MLHARGAAAIAALLLLSFPLLAQSGEASAIKAFKSGFKPKAKTIELSKTVMSLPTTSKQYVDEVGRVNDLANSWKDAVTSLTGHGSPAVAKLVAAAWTKVDKEVKPLWKQHSKLANRVGVTYAKYVKAKGGKDYPPGTKVPAKVNSAARTWIMVCRRQSEIRRSITMITQLHQALITVVKSMHDREGLDWFLSKLIGKGSHDLVLKIAVIRSASNLGATMAPSLITALDAGVKTGKAGELAALIQGVGLLNERARPCVPTLIQLMRHEDSGVREEAALALKHLKVGAAIEPMITLLAIESGQAKKRIAAALEVLTGQQHGMSAAAWRSWFAKEGADYAAGKKELGKGTPSALTKQAKESYYFGIPQDGKGIVYVIDCSGSMIVDKDNPEFDESVPQRPQPIPGKDKKNSRIEASKRELIRALGTLNSTQTFNIVWYSHTATLYKKKKMIQALPKNVKAAQAWVRKLTADSSTNIYAAMKLAFTLTGRGSFDKFYGVLFDTIFLMTDGKPTLQGVGDDDPERILEGVRKWNSLKRVVIHTIAMGEKGINHEFMKSLAEENKGTYEKPGKKKVGGAKKGR